MPFKETVESFVKTHLTAALNNKRLYCAWIPFTGTSKVYLRMGNTNSEFAKKVLVLSSCWYTGEEEKTELQFIEEIIADFEEIAKDNSLLPIVEYDQLLEAESLIDFFKQRGYETVKDRCNWMAKIS